MFANNFAQTASCAIADDRRSERAGSNEARAKRSGVLRPKNAQDKQPRALGAAVLFDLLELGRPSESALFGKCQSRRHVDCRSNKSCVSAPSICTAKVFRPATRDERLCK